MQVDLLSRFLGSPGMHVNDRQSIQSVLTAENNLRSLNLTNLTSPDLPLSARDTTASAVHQAEVRCGPLEQ